MSNMMDHLVSNNKDFPALGTLLPCAEFVPCAEHNVSVPLQPQSSLVGMFKVQVTLSFPVHRAMVRASHGTKQPATSHGLSQPVQ